MFRCVAATAAEVGASRPGDEIVASADVVMDRAFTLGAPPATVWPWLVQLGKGRAGWYLPWRLERRLPRPHRAARTVQPRWQQLGVGDVIPDYGGRRAGFEVASMAAPGSLVYRSQRGRTSISWSITLSDQPGQHTRVHLRLRLAPVRHRRLVDSAGGFVDALTVAGMAAGLRERLASV